MSITRRNLGILLTIAGFILATLAGLYLAIQVNSAVLDLGGLATQALLFFLVIGPFILGGIWLFNNSDELVAESSELVEQRAMLELLQEYGRMTFSEIAVSLSIPVDRVDSGMRDLIRLQVFAGGVNWGDEVLYGASVKAGQPCLHCGAILADEDMRMTCATCGTEYHRPG